MCYQPKTSYSGPAKNVVWLKQRLNGIGHMDATTVVFSSANQQVRTLIETFMGIYCIK